MGLNRTKTVVIFWKIWYEKSKKNRALKPRRSRPSETALRLRSFPRRGAAAMRKFFFQKKSKLKVFFTKFIILIVFSDIFSLCLGTINEIFHKIKENSFSIRFDEKMKILLTTKSFLRMNLWYCDTKIGVKRKHFFRNHVFSHP